MTSKLCAAAGRNSSDYGAADQDYADLNLEQQAQIVQDWFAGNATPFGQTGIPKDTNSPYFRYINGNVRLGVF